MKINEIYEKYKIIDNLREHQKRVAAVASFFAEKLAQEDKDKITTAALLHDMGNILKFNFDIFPEFFEKEGVQYWKNIKQEYVVKYGTDEHEATKKIIDEIGVSQEIHELVDNLGFMQAVGVRDEGDIRKMIMIYADQRVLPKKIGSLKERFEDGQKRYNFTEKQQDMIDALYDIEKTLCEKANIEPEEVNDATMQGRIEELSEFEII